MVHLRDPPHDVPVALPDAESLVHEVEVGVDLDDEDGAHVAVRAHDRDRHRVVSAQRHRQGVAGQDRLGRGLDVGQAGVRPAVDHVGVADVHDPDALQVDLVELRVVVPGRPHPVDGRRVSYAPRAVAGARPDLGPHVVWRSHDGDVGVQRQEVGLVRHLGESRQPGERKVEPILLHANLLRVPLATSLAKYPRAAYSDSKPKQLPCPVSVSERSSAPGRAFLSRSRSERCHGNDATDGGDDLAGGG